MTVVANWKFSVFAGGLVNVLTALYLFGILSSIVRSIRRWLGWAPVEASSPSPPAENQNSSDGSTTK
jgi:hypothetical protein